MNCCGGSNEIDDWFGSSAVGVQRSGGRQRRDEVIWAVYCGHSRLLEWRLVIESIADEVAGGAMSSGAVCTGVERESNGRRKTEGKQRKKKTEGRKEKKSNKAPASTIITMAPKAVIPKPSPSRRKPTTSTTTNWKTRIMDKNQAA